MFIPTHFLDRNFTLLGLIVVSNGVNPVRAVSKWNVVQSAAPTEPAPEGAADTASTASTDETTKTDRIERIPVEVRAAASRGFTRSRSTAIQGVAFVRDAEPNVEVIVVARPVLGEPLPEEPRVVEEDQGDPPA